MDVIFEVQNGRSFMIEIGYFDTILEIKEKIQKYKEIPISNQTLVFNGKVLEDSGDVSSCVILDRSRIRLLLKPLKETQHEESSKFKTPKKEADEYEKEVQLLHSIPPIKKARIILALSSSKPPYHHKLAIDVDLNNTVEHLKKKIHNMEGFPTNRTVLFIHRSTELQDFRRLRDYELKDGSEIDVVLKPVAGQGSSRRLKITVLSPCGTKRLPFEVNPMEKVQILRNKLEENKNFPLPPEGYFFIYKQNVMEEQETFQWHDVRPGETIEIFNGNVTGGL